MYNLNVSDFIIKAIELSEKSFNEGRFPAGALLLKSGEVTGEGISGKYPHIHMHAETKLIDDAMEKYNTQLSDFELITSMEPCMMCLGKAYWAGIRKITFVLAKEDIDQQLAYETTISTQDIKNKLNDGMELIQDKTYFKEALRVYTNWEMLHKKSAK